MRVAPMIQLSAQEEQKLVRLARSNTTSVRLARRVRIVLLAAAGMENQAIAAQLNIGRVQVGRCGSATHKAAWRPSSTSCRVAGAGPRWMPPRSCGVRTQTLSAAATQWSTRSLAREMGVSDTTVLRVWRAHGLKPHRVRGFKVSRDPKFMLDGQVIGQCQQRHTHAKWLKFLKKIDVVAEHGRTLLPRCYD